MFQKLIMIVVVFVSANSYADENWCIWDGEQYIKDRVVAGKVWLEVVLDLHTKGSAEVTSPFEGVGSCRFLDRNLGEKPADVIAAYVNGFSTIVATRAYLKMAESNEIVLPNAYYSAGNNWIHVNKDFYALDKVLCEKQKAQMTTLGQTAQGVRFSDVEFKTNSFGGVSAIINGNSPESNALGICHFH